MRSGWRVAALLVLVTSSTIALSPPVDAALQPTPDWVVGNWWQLASGDGRTLTFEVIGRSELTFDHAGTVDAFMVNWVLDTGNGTQRGRYYFEADTRALAVEEIFVQQEENSVYIRNEYDPAVPRPWHGAIHPPTPVTSEVRTYRSVNGAPLPPEDASILFQWTVRYLNQTIQTDAGEFEEFIRFVTTTNTGRRIFDYPTELGWYARWISQDDATGEEEVWTLTRFDTNRPPVPLLRGPTEVRVDEAFVLDASDSFDPDGSIDGIEWYLIEPGRSATLVGSGPTLNWTGNRTGTLVFNLVVTDDAGREGEALQRVRVRLGGQLSVSGPDTVAVDRPALFEADAVGADRISWSFGDGAFAVGHRVGHAYTDAGRYDVRVTASFDDGTTLRETLTVNVVERSADGGSDDLDGDLVLIAPGNGTIVGEVVDVFVEARGFDRVVASLGGNTDDGPGDGAVRLSLPVPDEGELRLVVSGERDGEVVEETEVVLHRSAAGTVGPGTGGGPGGGDGDGSSGEDTPTPAGLATLALATVALLLRRRR